MRTLLLGSVSLVDRQYCPLSMKFQTYSPFPSSLEDTVESMEHTREVLGLLPSNQVFLNVKGLVLVWTMIMEVNFHLIDCSAGNCLLNTAYQTAGHCQR